MKAIFVIFLLFFSFQINAQEVALANKAEYNNCLAKAVTTTEILSCMNQELKNLDKQIDTILAQQRKLMDAEQAKVSAAYHNAWLEWRSSHCDMSYLDGSIQRVNSASCLIQLSEDQLALLKGRTAPSTPDLESCLRRAGKIHSFQSICYRDELRKVEEILEDKYRNIMNHTLRRSEVTGLQQQWMSQKADLCKRPKFFQWDLYVEYMTCQINETKKRIETIKE